VIRRSFLVMVPVLLLLTACAWQAAPVTETPAPPTEALPTSEPAPTEVPVPVVTETSPPPAPLSFEASTYRDVSAGFELDYPSSWTLPEEGMQGDRGWVVQLSSGGQPRLDISVLQWDPKYDLTAYVAMRKAAFEASGFEILSEEVYVLRGNREGVGFVIQTQTGEQAFFFFTTARDRYLALSGSGDLQLLAEIAHSVRHLPVASSLSIPDSMDCSSIAEGTLEWVACNVRDGIISRNLSALHGYMADPFVIGYWGSESRAAAPAEVTDELYRYRLPPDPSTPMAFTIDRSFFPPLAGAPPEGLLGPDVKVVRVIYSEGWGSEGEGAALLFIAQDVSGKYYWRGMIYSEVHFDK